jgi:hypothetical protein
LGENALRHGSSADTVEVTLIPDDQVSVANDGPSNIEIPARLVHITDLVGMLQNLKFALNLSLVAVH